MTTHDLAPLPKGYFFRIDHPRTYVYPGMSLPSSSQLALTIMERQEGRRTFPPRHWWQREKLGPIETRDVETRHQVNLSPRAMPAEIAAKSRRLADALNRQLADAAHREALIGDYPPRTLSEIPA